MAAGSIVVDLLMRTGSFETSTDRAEKRLRQFEKQAAAVGKALGVAAVAAAAAGVAFVKSAIDNADAASKAAQAAGLAVEQYTALAYAAKLSGIEQAALGASMARLSRTAADAAGGNEKAAGAFGALGVRVTDTNGKLKDADALLLELAESFSRLPDGIEKSAAAQRIFGETGSRLIPLLNQGAAGIGKLKAEAEQLGLVIDTKTARAAEQFNDDMTRLRSSFDGFVLQVAAQVLPTLTRLSERLVQNARDAGIARGAFITLFEEMFGGTEPIDVITARVADLRKQIEGLQGLRAILPDQSGAEARDLLRQIEERGAALAQAERTLKLLQRDTQVRAPAPLALPAPAGAPPSTRPGRPQAQTFVSAITDPFEEQRQAFLQSEKAAYGLAAAIDDVAQSSQAWQADSLLVFQADQLRSAFEQIEDVNRAAQAEVQRTDRFAADLGLTFSSAFENAIVSGRSFSEVLRSIEQDILRIVTRDLITQPASDALRGLISGAGGAGGIFASVGSSLAGLFSGFFADGGYVPPGQWGIAGERGPEPIFGGRTGLTVQPAGGGMVVHQSFHITGPADMRTQQQIAAAAARGLQRAARDL